MRETFEQAGDAQLVVAIARRDRAALAEAYRRHSGRTYDLALRLLGVQAEADTVVAALFVELWEDPEHFEPGLCGLEVRLIAETHRRCVARLRARDGSSRTTPAPRDVDAPRQGVVHPRVADQVEAAIETLSDAERTIIELAYFQGHTYPSIAISLGLSTTETLAGMRSGLDHLGSLDARVPPRSGQAEGA